MNKETKKINEAVKVVVDSITSIDVDRESIKKAFSEQPNFSGSFRFGKDNKLGHFDLQTTRFGYNPNWEAPTDIKWNIMRDTDAELSEYSLNVSIKSDIEGHSEDIIYRWNDCNMNGGNEDKYSEAVAMFMDAIVLDVREAVNNERKHQLSRARMYRTQLLGSCNVKGIIQEYVDTIIFERDIDNDYNPYLPTFQPVVNSDDEVLHDYDANSWICHDEMIPGNIVKTHENCNTNIVGLSIDEILELWREGGLGNPLSRNLKLEFYHGDRAGYTAGLEINHIKHDEYGRWCTKKEESAMKKGYELVYTKITKNQSYTTQYATNPNTALKTMVADIESSFRQLRRRISDARDAVAKDNRFSILEAKIEEVISDLGIEMPAKPTCSPYKATEEEKEAWDVLGCDDYGRLRYAGSRKFEASKLGIDSKERVEIASNLDDNKVTVTVFNSDHYDYSFPSLKVNAMDTVEAIEAILTRLKTIADIKAEAKAKIEALGDITI